MAWFNNFFGYWIPINSEEDAHYAVRMAGLPVLFMGMSTAALALYLGLLPSHSTSLALATLAASITLLTAAFRLRAKHASWIPVIASMFVTAFVVALVITPSGTERGPHTFLTPIFPILCNLLLLNGLRGWFWFRWRGLPTTW